MTALETLTEMERLAQDGWCVVLKRLPPGRGWIIEGARSEYDAPCQDRTVGVGLWCCELSDMETKKGHQWRHPVDGLGKSADEAVAKARANAERDAAHFANTKTNA